MKLKSCSLALPAFIIIFSANTYSQKATLNSPATSYSVRVSSDTANQEIDNEIIENMEFLSEYDVMEDMDMFENFEVINDTDTEK